MARVRARCVCVRVGSGRRGVHARGLDGMSRCEKWGCVWTRTRGVRFRAFEFEAESRDFG